MGVAVLYPQDCLQDGGFHQRRRLISPPRSKPRRSSGTRSGRRKQSSPSGSPTPPPPQTKPKVQDFPAQVRILKRGEELTPPPKQSTSAETTPVKIPQSKRSGSVDRSNSDSVVLSDRFSPDPVPAQIPSSFLAGFYAGSAFSTSPPPPSSLPLPGFCTKSITGSGAFPVGMDKSTVEDATVSLLRILKIDITSD